MAKAKRERRTSFRTMDGDSAFDALERIAEMERQEQLANPAMHPDPSVAVDTTEDDSDTQ